jgi:hypothetical protein
MGRSVCFACVSVVSLNLVLAFAVTGCRVASESSPTQQAVETGVVAAAPAPETSTPSEQPPEAAEGAAAPASSPKQSAAAPVSATSSTQPSQDATSSQQPAEASEPAATAPAEGATASAQPPTTEQSAAQAASDPSVVATIGDFIITKDDLATRCLQELRPQGEQYTRPPEPVTAEAVLLTMISEKAMMMEGRKLGYLKDPALSSYIEQQRRRRLGTAVVTDYVNKNVTVTDAEVDEAMKKDARLTREQARMVAIRPKATAVLQEYYKQLVEKFHLRQVQENFAKASEIHERLLNSTTRPPNIRWIQNNQIRDEVSAEEKAIVLASYDGGQVTVLDWLEALCQLAPPGRPRNLNTPEGVGQLLERTVGPMILLAEAKAGGYDKDPKYLRDMRDLEDQHLLWKFQQEKTKDLPKPNDEEIKAFFDEHQEWFAESAVLKVDQVWCRDLATAEEVKKKLDAGEDVQAVRKAYSLDQTETPYYSLYPSGEGLFWNDLWKGDPNEVIGPVKGLYTDGVRWRVMKILEKKPATIRPYSEQTKTPAGWALMAERRQAVIDDCGKELREKYDYKVYAERIKDIDPLAVVTGDVRK